MDYPCFVKAMGLPSFVVNSTSKSISKRTGMDFNTTSWRPHVEKVSIPTLIIQNRNDGYLNEDFVTGVYDDLKVEKELLWIEIPKRKNAFENRMAGYDWLGTHSEPILGWFDKHMA